MNKYFRAAFIVIFITPVIITVLIFYHNRKDNYITYFDSGSVRVGYAVEMPYAYVDENGIVTGESPETARRILERLGIKNIKWTQTEFDSLITGLNSGRFDIIAAGMYITKERSKQISFSNPSFHVKQGLLFLKGKIDNRIKTLLSHRIIRKQEKCY